MTTHRFLLAHAFTAAILGTLISLPHRATAQTFPQDTTNAPPTFVFPNNNPDTDPPLPPGSADSIAARMAQRRAQQRDVSGRGLPAPVPIAAGPGDPAPEPVATMTTSQIGGERALSMNYENVTVESVLKDVSEAFGFIIVKNIVLPQRITIHVPRPVNASEALQLLNAALLTQGYGTLATKTNNTPQAKTILRIASVAEIKKAQIPVRQGADPNLISLDDEIVTQVMPIKNISAAGLLNDLRPMMSSDADATTNNASNCIIVTDTSAKIHRLAELILSLDKVAADRPNVPVTRGTTGRGPGEMRVISGAATSDPFPPRNDFTAEVQSPKVTLTAPAAGILSKVNAREGQRVKAGDLLAEFDPRAAQIDLQLAQSRLAVARAQLTPPGASPAELERLKADITAAEAQVSLSRYHLDALQIKAPIDGTLTTLDLSSGQYVAAGTAITQVVDTSDEDFKLSFKLPFSDRARLKIGQKISFSAGDKFTFPAEITFISPAADANNRTEIHARFTAPATSLIPGVLGTITIPDP